MRRFPKPPRKENRWTQDDLIDGFIMEKQTEYEMTYSFTLDKFVDFMLIQSNVNAKIESGTVTTDNARNWMTESLESVFANEEKQLIFYG